MKTTYLNEESFARLVIRYERPCASPWGKSHGEVVPRVLPVCFGDGRKLVQVSFYGAPEMVVLVPFESTLPLDVDLPDRCQESATVRCFRDLTDRVKALCEEYFGDKPPVGADRLRRLKAEAKLEQMSVWELIRRDGSTWGFWESLTESEVGA